MHAASVKLSEFAWSSLTKEAERQGVPVEELLAHAAMYYLADLDSGRVATRALKTSDAEEDEAPRGERFRRAG